MNAWLLGLSAILALVWSATLLRLRSMSAEKDEYQQALMHERQRADEAERRSMFISALNRSFVEQASAALLLVDLQRRVTYFNPAASRLFDLEVSSPGIKPLIEVVGDHDLEAMVRAVLSGSSAAEVVEVQPPGTERVLQATARPIFGDEGRISGATVVIEDQTELHRLEVIRREFVANVSHELRTPLAAVKAMVETLEGGALKSRTITKDFLAKINRELDGLTALVRDLLELSRIESRHFPLDVERFDLNEVVEDVVGRMRPAARARRLTLSIENPDRPWVLADRRRASQILTNLVDNAIKFSRPSGTVTIRVEARDSAVIAVNDTGVGISEGDLPRVFERFYKADKGRARSENGGTGLGLAIAKHLTQAMGGRMWAESQEGWGSTFIFTLPLVNRWEGMPLTFAEPDFIRNQIPQEATP